MPATASSKSYSLDMKEQLIQQWQFEPVLKFHRVNVASHITVEYGNPLTRNQLMLSFIKKDYLIEDQSIND